MGFSEEILSRIDVEDFLAREGVEYRHGHGSSGPQINLRECPFCHDERWKVYLNAETGLGKCFVCEEGINKWKLIQVHTGLSNRNTANYCRNLVEEYGWVPKQESKPVQEIFQAALRLPASFEQPLAGKVIPYLENRGITPQVASYFHLRFCPMGEYVYTLNGEQRSMDFSHRVIIPVFDRQGVLVSFQGRDVTGTAKKKYLFPTGFATTGRYLYNAHNAIGAKTVVLGEGVFDVMALKIALDTDETLRGVVPLGTFGKHLAIADGSDHLGELLALKQAGLKTIVFMWDGAQDAVKAAIKAGAQLLPYGFNVRIAILPRDKDPNEVSAKTVLQALYESTLLDSISLARLRLSHMGT